MSSCSACSHRRFAGSAVAARLPEPVAGNSSTGAGASRETVPLRVLFALRVQVVGLERVVGLLLRELVRYRLLPQGGSSGAGPTETRSGSPTPRPHPLLVSGLERVVGLLLRELVRYRLLPQGGSSGAGPTETRSGSRTGCSITCLVVALNNARFLGSPRHS